jgi:hypothetical protein
MELQRKNIETSMTYFIRGKFEIFGISNFFFVSVGYGLAQRPA